MLAYVILEGVLFGKLLITGHLRLLTTCLGVHTLLIFLVACDLL